VIVLSWREHTTVEKAQRVSIVVGGTIDNSIRQAVHGGKRPRIDVIELEKALGARVFEFSQLKANRGLGSPAHVAGYLAQRTGQWSVALAVYATPKLKRDDVIYATGEDVGLAIAAQLRLLRMRGPRLVVRLEQPTYGRTLARRTIYNAYLQFAAKRIDMIVCRTAAHMHYLNSVSRIPLEKLALVHESTDPDFYSSAADPSTPAPAEQPYILAAGLEMRDYATLVRAVEGMPVNLVIAAGSPWSHFAAGIDTADLPPNVRVSSYVPVQMRALYRDAELVVVPVKPTLRACGMNVVLEAWAMEKAVVVSRTAGLLDYIRDGQDAVFVEPVDIEAVRSTIEAVRADDGLRRYLGTEGRRRVESDLNLGNYVQRIAGIITAGAKNKLA
jgi:glycosyltransferase involved in cell wall biosynthesis